MAFLAACNPLAQPENRWSVGWLVDASHGTTRSLSHSKLTRFPLGSSENLEVLTFGRFGTSRSYKSARNTHQGPISLGDIIPVLCVYVHVYIDICVCVCVCVCVYIYLFIIYLFIFNLFMWSVCIYRERESVCIYIVHIYIVYEYIYIFIYL